MVQDRVSGSTLSVADLLFIRPRHKLPVSIHDTGFASPPLLPAFAGLVSTAQD